MKSCLKHITLLSFILLLTIGCNTSSKSTNVTTNNITTNADTIECGDLLERYAQKPKGLIYIDCISNKTFQTIVSAEYRTSGENSENVEQFLVNKYGMGKLKWICCAWGNGGKYGGFQHQDITNINSNYMVTISMYASGEVEDEEGKVTIEKDKHKIEYFTVIVEILDV